MEINYSKVYEKDRIRERAEKGLEEFLNNDDINLRILGRLIVKERLALINQELEDRIEELSCNVQELKEARERVAESQEELES
jgi:chaperonin cofactor prefoldin